MHTYLVKCTVHCTVLMGFQHILLTYEHMYEYVLMCYTFIQIKMDGNNWEDNPDREILDMAGVKTRHDERGLVYDDDK